MKAAEALIAWEPASDQPGKDGSPPPGSIAIGRLLGEHGADWTRAYSYTGGAAYIERRSMKPNGQKFAVMMDWYQLVYVYGIDPYVAHRAFLLIDEYVETIKDAGFGPAKDEPGHDPDIPFGRAILLPAPDLKIFKSGEAMHFWPKSDKE